MGMDFATSLIFLILLAIDSLTVVPFPVCAMRKQLFTAQRENKNPVWFWSCELWSLAIQKHSNKIRWSIYSFFTPWDSVNFLLVNKPWEHTRTWEDWAYSCINLWYGWKNIKWANLPSVAYQTLPSIMFILYKEDNCRMHCDKTDPICWTECRVLLIIKIFTYVFKYKMLKKQWDPLQKSSLVHVYRENN